MIPQLRFPEFVDDWSEKHYNDFYSFKTTNSFSRDKLNYEKGEVKNIHYGDIHTKFNSLFDIENEYVPFINDEVDISRIPDECYLKEGDLVVADASEDYNDIGKTIEIHSLNGEKVLAGLHTFLARKESDEMANGFASFLMKTHRVRLEIMKIAQGTKVLGISKNRLDKIFLIVPNPTEQTKIANFLTAVNKRNSLLQKKKSELERYKKGVMQKLFSQTIRFKDENGNNFPDWEEKKLEEVAKIITGSTPSTNKKKYYNGERLFVSPVDINSSRLIKTTQTKVTELGFQQGRAVKANSVLFVCIGSTIGKIGQVTEECITNQQLNSLEANKNNNNSFIYYILQFNADRIKLLAGVQAVPQINKSDFSQLKFMFPEVNEQKKIASFLNTIDKKIEGLTKQINDSELWEKGLLQKMFV